MVRTALIHLFRRAYEIDRLTHTCHQSPAEARENLAHHLSRRQLLRGMAIAGVMATPPFQGFTTAAQTRSPIASPSSSVLSSVLVVGAGIAGLTAAYRLHQAGVSVDVIEANPKVGGRLRTVTHHPLVPSPAELGGEFIDTRHTFVLSLVRELGLTVSDLRQADANLEPEVLYFQGQTLRPEWVVEEFVPLARQIAADLQSLSDRTITYHHPNPAAQRLDRLTLAQYLEAAPGNATIKDLVKVAYVTEFGRDADEQTCLNMLFMIGAEAGKWSTYGISDERWHIVGGNESLPHRLAEHLADRIEFSTALESLRETAEGRYRVSLRRGSTSIDRTYDRILLAIPFSTLRLVNLEVEMPAVKQQAIAELGYGMSTKLLIPFEERLWRTQYHSTISTYSDRAFQNTWESARYSEGPGGWVTDLRGGREGVLLGAGNPDTHAQALVTELNALFPGLQDVKRGRALRAFWPAEVNAFGSYSCYLPGQWTTFCGAEAERVGNLWFAGEHCSVGSQGYINGACETAEVAALEILQDIGMGQRAKMQRDRITATRRASLLAV